MSVEPVGALTILVALACLALGHLAAVRAMVVAGLLGSAAALILGSANVSPGHLLVGVVALTVLTRRREAAEALRALAPGEPGFWLACVVAYGIVGGAVLPRALAGVTEVVPVGTSDAITSAGGTIPLGPVSGNVTQAIYLVADVACFAMVRAVAATGAGFRAVAGAMIAYAVANVGFALVDVATYATGTEWVMGFVRNAQYALHLDEEAVGLKRIAGSFTEASSFATVTTGALGYVGTLWVCGRRTALTGPLSLASVALVVLSTSSTGLVGLPPTLLLVYGTAVGRCGTGRSGRNAAVAVVAGPVVALVAALGVALDGHAWDAARDYLTALVFEKGASQSGIERAAWNAAAWSNFVDTRGLGVGLGSARASSFALALASNLGVPGLLAYAAFAWSALGRRRGVPRGLEDDVRVAARNACLGLLTANVISGAFVDQGLAFYVLAALACAVPEVAAARAPAGPGPSTWRPEAGWAR